MDSLQFSFIVPVYNRPAEMQKLLESLAGLNYSKRFEVVVVEDGSVESSEAVCVRFRESVNITYLTKSNTGPGDSRNYGMRHANGNYFIILDSDCIIPPDYLSTVEQELAQGFVDCYGGPDAAHEQFTDLQKAINFSMTSMLTTGGIRGGNEGLGKFQPRSFNMGLSKQAFEATRGFGSIHPGEDPDLSIRLWQKGFETALFKQAFVFHERRISWSLFYRQVKKFGMVRVILNKWHPNTVKFTYWFPTLFLIFGVISILMLFAGVQVFFLLLLFYLGAIAASSAFKNGFKVGVMSALAAIIQFTGYGYGYLISYIQICIKKRDERIAFPHLFFEK